ncbi:glycoside hydrolase superfamily [Microdochium bolleyi]|uniref:alpha-galactosidase n=1 Tax=Microdochium bolleyi TaxID=196109 RepID=A0A136IVH8_9PEZI|nr:glycoside hydrolase superfamily [Microdochium bolleyi]
MKANNIAVLIGANLLAASHGASALWQPTKGTTWQLVLEKPLDMTRAVVNNKMTPDVAVYDIDLFTNTDNGKDKERVIGRLHGLGKKVICYFSAGTYEPYRQDSGQFKTADLGASLPDWPDERWLNTNSDNVRSIMAKRIKLAADMGCDAIDPDNMDAYNNQKGGGFKTPLTETDAINYVGFLSAEAKKWNMAMGLKNAGDIAANVTGLVQFSVNEECSVWAGDCATLAAAFTKLNKPVFHVEYPDEEKYWKGDKEGFTDAAVRAKHCGAAGEADFSTILALYALNGWVQWCDAKGSIFTTPTQN